ncbi:hypothetical protein [Halobacteriovorax marinus]|uniref:hypothetical protein n=1 Tax=Halobacteriovorax marinus TaxID=97084 RepID=UPI003A8D76DD
MENPNLNTMAIPTNFYNEFYQLSRQALLIMFAGILLVHFINYILFLKGKKFAYKYIKLQSCLGGLLLFFMGFPNLFNGWFYLLYALVGGLMFLSFLGLSQDRFKI